MSGWSWWTRERAVAVTGTTWEFTLLGDVQPDGKIVLYSWDHATGWLHRETLATFEGDDHNNPAIVAEAGKVPLVFYCRHAKDGLLRYRRGTKNVGTEFPVRSFAAEATITIPTGLTTYAQVFTYGNEIHVFCRSTQRYWVHVASTDWGVTWGTPQAVFDGQEDATAVHLYAPMALAGGADQIVRVAMASHPSQDVLPGDIYYAEVGLVSGNVTTPALGTLGNIYTGTGLPLKRSQIDRIWDAPAGWRSWAFDVGNGTEPEIVWCTWDENDPVGTSRYYYAVRTGGAWQVHDTGASAGPGWNIGIPAGADLYQGGAQFFAPGVLLLSRQVGSTWTIERWTTTDHGATWTSEVLATSTDKLIRPWKVKNGNRIKVVYQKATHYGETGTGEGYLDWTGSVVGIAA